MRTHPARGAAACLLLLLLAPARAAAQDGPGDWTIVGDVPEGQGVLRPSLWLPTSWRDRTDTAMTDVLGTHAAVFFAPSPRTVVLLQGLFERPEQVPVVAWERATLTPAGGEPMPVLAGEPPWNDHPAGADVSPPLKGGVLAHCRIPFPALDPACGDVTFSVPVADREPLVVRFRRWREWIAEAEADLAAWKQHVTASSQFSALQPYLQGEGFRRFTAHGEPLVPALLLRELKRGEAGDRAALPRFLVLHVLAGTEWGRRLAVPDHGNERDAARVLERWSELGAPRLPGIAPPER